VKDYNKGGLSILSAPGGRQANEDNAGSLVTMRGILVIVCDGVGGADCGEYASRVRTCWR